MEEGHLLPNDVQEWADRIRVGHDEWSRAQGGDVIVTTADGLAHYRHDELWEEITFLGYHLHWDLATLLDLEHGDRRRLVRSVSEMNERAWREVARHG